jgi:hypothetical protein
MQKLIDSTLVIVLHNGEYEIEGELATPADALRIAPATQTRRGRLKSAMCSKCCRQTERRSARAGPIKNRHR